MYREIISPAGIIILHSDGELIKGLKFGNLPTGFDNSDCGVLLEAERQLSEYFARKRRVFELPLGLEGTEFQLKVWSALLEVPRGQTRTYGEIAADIGNPKAARAVGMANNRNPVSIIVPCHRIIGKGGALVGYGGGLHVKRLLLDIEEISVSN